MCVYLCMFVYFMCMCMYMCVCFMCMCICDFRNFACNLLVGYVLFVRRLCFIVNFFLGLQFVKFLFSQGPQFVWFVFGGANHNQTLICMISVWLCVICSSVMFGYVLLRPPICMIFVWLCVRIWWFCSSLKCVGSIV